MSNYLYYHSLVIDVLARLRKLRRGLSPILSAIFLMGVLLAAIASAMLIIYPQMNTLSDNIELINAATTLQSMDEDIKTLILNGEGGKLTKSIQLGPTADIKTDTTSSSSIYFLQSLNGGPLTQLRAPYVESLNRFIISFNLENKNTIPANTHAYLTGSEFQNVFFLNQTNKASMPWVILNQSRAVSDIVDSSLAYRGLISPSKVIDSTTQTTRLTINIQMVELSFPGKTSTSVSNPTIKMEYTSLNVTTTPFTIIDNLAGDAIIFYLKTVTTLNGQNRVEIPLAHEVPVGGFLEIRLQIFTHNINITF